MIHDQCSTGHYIGEGAGYNGHYNITGWGVVCWREEETEQLTLPGGRGLLGGEEGEDVDEGGGAEEAQGHELQGDRRQLGRQGRVSLKVEVCQDGCCVHRE